VLDRCQKTLQPMPRRFCRALVTAEPSLLRSALILYCTFSYDSSVYCNLLCRALPCSCTTMHHRLPGISAIMRFDYSNQQQLTSTNYCNVITSIRSCFFYCCSHEALYHAMRVLLCSIGCVRAGPRDAEPAVCAISRVAVQGLPRAA
jgi:hypothetical protein